MLGGGVGMDDQSHVVDVNSPCRDVGGDQRRRPTVVERLEVSGARILGKVAVQLDSRYAIAVELTGQCLGATLRTGEDHRSPRRADQVDQDRQPVFAIHMQDVVRHRADR